LGRRQPKNLTAIYVTHGHADHFFGLAPLLAHFPKAKAVATPAVVKAMHDQLSSVSVEERWKKFFPGQIPERLVPAEPLAGGTLDLEGVAGDVVYNGIHGGSIPIAPIRVRSGVQPTPRRRRRPVSRDYCGGGVHFRVPPSLVMSAPRQVRRAIEVSL
jgi:hypothetical protein